VAVRLLTHRWLGSAALAVTLAACTQAAAEAPHGAVEGAVAEVPITAEVAGLPVEVAVPPATAPGAATRAPGSDGHFELPASAVFPTAVVPVPRPAADVPVSAEINGVRRDWTVVVPPGTTDAMKLPLLIVLHGVGGKGAGMRRLGFERYAATAGVLVAYPDAVGGSWNDGRPGMEPLVGTAVDDVAFLRELISRTAGDMGADPKRVAIAGFSNGALMASRAACDLSDQLEAVVLVSGSAPKDVALRCKPARPVPLMVVFGTADTVVPYEGGTVAAYGGKARGVVAPVHELLDLWRRADGCAGVETVAVSATPVVTMQRGKGCTADVVHYCVTGGGHEWLATATFDTTATAWQFVSAHYA
jgi:polyhydroxybutyrate depolymerase